LPTPRRASATTSEPAYLAKDVSGQVSPKSEIAALDILRCVAALCVVVYHFLYADWTEARGNGSIPDLVSRSLRFPEAVSLTWWGGIGVEIFFVISGFVIVMSAAKGTAAQFALGRFKRLYPALLTFASLSCLTLILSGVLSPIEALERWARALVLLPKGPWIDGAVWTLTVEIVFYLLIFLCLYLGKRDRLFTYARYALCILFLFSAVVFVQAHHSLGTLGALSNRIAKAYFSRPLLLTTGSFFLVGVFGYEIYAQGLNWQRALCASLAALVSAYWIQFRALSSTGVTEFGRSAYVPVIVWAGALTLCVAAMALERKIELSAKTRQMARRIGLMTYPLYLINQIFGGWILGRLCALGLNPWLSVALTIGLICTISSLFATYGEPRLRANLLSLPSRLAHFRQA